MSRFNVMPPEPTALTVADEFTVPCPYCHTFGTHTSECSLSQAHSGEVYAIVARKVTFVPPVRNT